MEKQALRGGLGIPAERRRLAPLVGGLLLAGFLLGSGAPAVAAPRVGEGWIELESAHFRLISNAGERKTAEIATSLERFRAVLGRLRPGAIFHSPVPTKILVFRNERAFRPYKRWRGGDDTLVGFFIGHPHGNYIALNAFPSRGDALSVIYHEYVHFYVRHNFPNLPLALNEGLAEYYSTFGVIGGKAQIGYAVPHHLRWVKGHSFLSTGELFAIDQDSPEYSEQEKKGAFYAQAWVLVHYLFSGEDEDRQRALELLGRLNAGQTPEVAFQAALGVGVAEHESRLRRYVNGRQFPFLELDLGDLRVPAGSTVRSLPQEEVLFHLGDLLVHTRPEEAPAAREHFQAALKLDPSYADAYLGMALVAREQGQPSAAEPFLAKALDLGSANPLTYLVYGDLLLDRLEALSLSERAAQASPLWRRARELLARAAELAPDFAEPHVLLGSTYFYDPEGVDEGIFHLRQALELLPGRPEVPYNLGLLLLRRGDWQEARHVAETYLGASARTDLYRGLTEAARRTRLVQETNEAIAAGDAERAVEIFQEALASTTDPEIRAHLQDQLRTLELQAEKQSQIDRYNHAVRLTNEGSLAAALEELRALLPEIKDVNLKVEARGLIRELEEVVEP